MNKRMPDWFIPAVSAGLFLTVFFNRYSNEQPLTSEEIAALTTQTMETVTEEAAEHGVEFIEFTPSQEGLSDGQQAIEFLTQISELSQDKLVAVDLFAQWCAPCHLLTPKLPEAIQASGQEGVVMKVDVDEFPFIASLVSTENGVPQVAWFKNTHVLGSFTGNRDVEAITDFINTSITDYEAMRERLDPHCLEDHSEFPSLDACIGEHISDEDHLHSFTADDFDPT